MDHTDQSLFAAERAPESRPLVLVVENHDDTRLLLRLVAETQGCRVVEALDGEECLRLLTVVRPTMILMDTNLPLVDGLMATRTIRSLPNGGSVPIVFVSGNGQPEYRQLALSAGVNDYFVKPISLKDLENAIVHYGSKRN